MDPTLHYKTKVMKPMMNLMTVLQTRCEFKGPVHAHRDGNQKQMVVGVDREHRDGCAS